MAKKKQDKKSTKSVSKTISKASKASAKKSTAKKPASKSAKKATKKPAPKPVKKATKKPAPKPVKKAAKKPAPKPVKKATKKPAPKPVKKATKKPALKPEKKATKKPAPKPEKKAIKKPAPKPEKKAAKEPAPEPEQKATKEPAPEPEKKAAKEPAPEPTTQVVDTPAPEPEKAPPVATPLSSPLLTVLTTPPIVVVETAETKATNAAKEASLRYTLKIGEIFRKKPEGFKEIESNLVHSRKARLSNLPIDALNRFIPLVEKHGATEVYVHEDVDQSKIKFKQAQVMTFEYRWYQVLFGTKCHIGEVLTPTGLYRVFWTDNGKIHRIFSNTDPKCIQCVWKKNFMAKAREDHTHATVYDRREGLNVILRKASKASVFRACILPPPLIKRILPFALLADYRVIFSRLDPLIPRFKGNFDARVGSKAKVYFMYGGEEANVGNLRLDHEMFSIFWRGNKVFNVMKFESLICSNCICRVFDTAWKYSEEL